MTHTSWTDLLDPDERAIRDVWPDDLHPAALEKLLEPATSDDEPRPKLEAHGSYVFGLFLVPVAVPDEDRVYYQQLHMLLTHSHLVTVRKTPPEGRPFDVTTAREAYEHDHRASAGMCAYRLIDEVAERYLDLTDDVGDEIDELEEHVEEWTPQRVRRRLSDLRHDLLRIRRTLAPTRDAVRGVFDNRVDIDGEELFPREIELHFHDAYDKLLRASEALELSRDLVAGVRDYHQTKVANDQNEVMKRLTVVASILLVPTLIVGVYGQNLEGAPELHWSYGYWWSWGLILVTTLLQLVYFRRKRWI